MFITHGPKWRRPLLDTGLCPLSSSPNRFGLHSNLIACRPIYVFPLSRSLTHVHAKLHLTLWANKFELRLSRAPTLELNKADGAPPNICSCSETVLLFDLLPRCPPAYQARCTANTYSGFRINIQSNFSGGKTIVTSLGSGIASPSPHFHSP